MLYKTIKKKHPQKYLLRHHSLQKCQQKQNKKLDTKFTSLDTNGKVDNNFEIRTF